MNIKYYQLFWVILLILAKDLNINKIISLYNELISNTHQKAKTNISSFDRCLILISIEEPIRFIEG